MLKPDYATLEKLAKNYSVIPVCREVLGDSTTPIAVLKRLAAKSSRYFLLESVEGGEKWGRYSFLGCDPKLRIFCRQGKVRVRGEEGEYETTEKPLEAVRKLMKKYKAPVLPDYPPFTGGLVGYFSYSVIGLAEPVLHIKNEKFPDFDLFLFDKVIAYDHLKQRYPVYGLQFHPESVLTPKGMRILENFVKIERKERKAMIKEAIHTLMEGKDLSYEMAKGVMEEMMDGTATQAQMGAFLAALRMQGETIEEITAFAQVMREKGIKIQPQREVIDIVGTGGDEAGTFNISTTSAFVVAAGGIPVAKHGNRSVSSKSGAADVLEKLGANVSLDPEQNETILNRTGMCFLFAPVYHSSMKYAAPVRQQMGVRTVFNILGPLSNPAAATMQLLGVYDKKLAEPLAKVLGNLGVTRGVAVCGADGLDEITLTGETLVCEIRFGEVKSYTISPEQFGMERCELSCLAGGDPRENAGITRDILEGRERGPKREVVLLNAGMSLYLGIDGITLEEGVKMAGEIIDRGKAAEKLEEFIKATKEYEV